MKHLSIALVCIVALIYELCVIYGFYHLVFVLNNSAWWIILGVLFTESCGMFTYKIVNAITHNKMIVYGKRP